MAEDIFVIVDAGATKTDFVVLKDKEIVHRFSDAGINANYSSDEQIREVFAHFVQARPSEYQEIHRMVYYGAGCANEHNASRIAKVITTFFPQIPFKVCSDLLEACHALCGRQPGLVAILGTGSSSCLYDGQSIVDRAPSLGYMIGDEGSGTYLGKKFITAYLMKKLPLDLTKELEQNFDINPPKVIHRIYQGAHPNNFFASFSPFIQAHLDIIEVKSLCKSAFAEFFDSQIGYYDKNAYSQVHLLGSVAFHFQDVIQEVAAEKKINMGTIIASPIPKLINYYTQDL